MDVATQNPTGAPNPASLTGTLTSQGVLDQQQAALVADMAPTLARVVGVPPTERLDGRVLEQALVARVRP